MRFKILGSGSSGNCALLDTGETRVLIDAGFSARRTAALLAESGESLERIDAIFLTHEHGDHAGGIESLARAVPDRPVFANRATAEAVQGGCKRPIRWVHFQTGAAFTFRDIEVGTFALPHDAQEPVGFTLRAKRSVSEGASTACSVAWMTDLGHVPEALLRAVRAVDCLVLEANYDEGLLQQDAKRPWTVKQRISGRHGHLSNRDAAAFLATGADADWKRVFLAHLSRDCNSAEAIDLAMAPLRNRSRFAIEIVPAGGSSPIHEFA